MTKCIKVIHQGQQWQLEDNGDVLLEQLRQLPLGLRQACRNGVCRVCSCRLVDGEIDYGIRQPTALWDHQIAAGYILPCIATVKTDISITELSEQS